MLREIAAADYAWKVDECYQSLQPVLKTGVIAPMISTPPGWPEADLFTALRESLGLKLERRDVQVQFLLIDHIERIPTEN